jgi:hypothetical protein
MTVADLISMLQLQDPEAEVVHCSQDDVGFSRVRKVTPLELPLTQPKASNDCIT